MLSQLKKKRTLKGKRYVFALLLLVVVGGVAYFYQRDIRLLLLTGNLPHKEIIERVARKYCIDSRLVIAVIMKESSFRVDCIGNAGEIGLMQIMPKSAAKDWARVKKVPELSAGELMKPEMNIEVGTWYLARAVRRWQRYSKYIELALCEYNAGISRAKKWKPAKFDGEVMNNIKIGSTKLYVRQVMADYNKLKKK